MFCFLIGLFCEATSAGLGNEPTLAGTRDESTSAPPPSFPLKLEVEKTPVELGELRLETANGLIIVPPYGWNRDGTVVNPKHMNVVEALAARHRLIAFANKFGNIRVEPARCYNGPIEYFLKPKPNLRGEVRIKNRDTLAAAEELFQIGKTAVLDCANAYNPCGGTHHGSKAQEETLCYESSQLSLMLYDAWQRFKEAGKPFIPLAAAILLPEVHVDGEGWNVDVVAAALPQWKILDEKIGSGFVLASRDLPAYQERFRTDATTIARPPFIGHNDTINWDDPYPKLVLETAQTILDVAILNGDINMVLGAIGCGVFNNDPILVAKAFKEALQELTKAGHKRIDYFNSIVFAILEKTSKLGPIFAKEFEDRGVTAGSAIPGKVSLGGNSE